MIKDSIILTIHDKAWLIPQVLKGIFKNTKTNTELILVFDGCSDNSEEVADKTLQQCPANLEVIKTHTPDVFETRANNAGMRMASGENLIIVQDDMVIKEENWNVRMRKPVEQFSDVFAVTARTAHNWVYNSNSVHEHMLENLDNCWCDILNHTEHANRNNTDRDTFAIRDSVNRGPLLLRHDVMKMNGYLPEEKIVRQDMDDHYLCYDVYKKYGLKCGLYWIEFVSSDEWGGTRANNNNQPNKWLLKCNHANVKTVWKDHKEAILAPKHNENRFLKE